MTLVSLFSRLICVSFVVNAASVDDPFRLSNIDASEVPRLLVQVDVRSTDGKQTLRPADFRLREDGVATNTATKALPFRDTGRGIALIVALDASGSMNGPPMVAIREGLAKLVARKRDVDRVAVLSFADDIRWETRWDSPPATIEPAFRNLVSRGRSTHLYDAVVAALDELSNEGKRTTGFPLRTAILLISDGHDEGSRATLESLLNRVGGDFVRLDAAGLARSPEWFDSMRKLAHSGFGGFEAATTPASLSAILERGLDRILDAPVLDFTSSKLSSDGKVHLIGVRHTPSNWDSEIKASLPESWWRKPWILYGAATGTVGVLVLTFFIVRSARRVKPAPQIAVAAAASASTPGPVRGSSSGSQRPILIAQDPILPSLQPFPDHRTQPVAARLEATMLAPSSSVAAPSLLSAVAGPYAGRTFARTGEEFWIGSRENNQLCLAADTLVSGNHACIRQEGDLLRLYDHGSLNGTWVNGRAIGTEVIIVQKGDHIRIGSSELILG